MLAYTKAKLIGAVAASLVLGGAGVVVLDRALADNGNQAATVARANAGPPGAVNNVTLTAVVAPASSIARVNPAPSIPSVLVPPPTDSNSPSARVAPPAAAGTNAPAMSAGSPAGFGEIRTIGWGSYDPSNPVPDLSK